MPVNNTFHYLWIGACLLICLTFMYLVIGLGFHGLTAENSWLENLQVITLFLAMMAFGKQAWHFTGRLRGACSFFAWLMWLFIMREVDFDKLGIHPMLVYLWAEQGRALFYIIALALLFRECWHWRFYWQFRQSILRSSFFWYISCAAFALIVLSTGFDKQIFDVPHYQLYEETSEAFAYFMLLGAAVFARKSLSKLL